MNAFKLTYRPEIDGLRALAVISVILFHAGSTIFSGGFVGVDVFFVISGYLITAIILDEIDNNAFSAFHFYERRARRILPALFLVLIICLPFAWFLMLPSEMKAFSDSLIAVCTLVSNLWFWKTTNYFDNAAHLKPLLHTWSLSVEEQFYIFFPFLLIVLYKFNKKALILGLMALALASLGLADWLSVHKTSAAFYLLPPRIWELLLGALSAIYLRDSHVFQEARFIGGLGGYFGMALMFYAIFFFDKQTRTPSYFTLIPTLGTICVILFVTKDSLLRNILGHRILVGTGLLSYSAYLWHQPVFAFAQLSGLLDRHKEIKWFLLMIIFSIAYLSWRYVEAPFRDIKKVKRKTFLKLSAVIIFFLVLFGLMSHLSSGFLFRYAAEDQAIAALDGYLEGNYVSKRFDERLLIPFSPLDDRRKILIIGDSYAQDLVNALYESGFDKITQISTRHISHLCGNLFISDAAFSRKVIQRDYLKCRGTGIYEDDALKK